MSIHLEAKQGEIAETVLLPGDPMRAKFFAEKMLTESHCYNRVRGMFGYTGFYHGKRVSIQGTGMGMGSSAIYINELVQNHPIKNLIRVGTFGAIQKEIEVGQVVLAMSASGDSSANAFNFGGLDYAATADFDLLLKAYQVAQELNIPTLQGSVFSTDTFYDNNPKRWDIWEKHGVLGVEMESQILFTLAKKFKIKALSILTASDNILTGEASNSKDREQSYDDMFKIALELI